MNDLQLDYFMAVATNLSFTKTSEELYVSQPAISRQISQLEKELGCKLFKRNNQGTELTEEGRLYFDLFSKYKAEFINTRLRAERITGKNNAVIRVGFLEGWDLFDIIPPMMKRYKEAFPESEVVINCCGVKELATGLLTDTLDIVVTIQNSVKMYSEFECIDAAEIQKILLFAASHPLANKEPGELTLKDFSSDLFIAPWEIVDKMIIDAISNYTRPYGFIPKLRFVKNHESTVTCVRNNMGVMIGDEWVWAKNADDIRWIPFNAHDIIAVARLRTKDNDNVLAMEKILSDIVKTHKNKDDAHRL
jgi:DNA-binding transcriptional LysR family regulator